MPDARGSDRSALAAAALLLLSASGPTGTARGDDAAPPVSPFSVVESAPTDAKASRKSAAAPVARLLVTPWTRSPLTVTLDGRTATAERGLQIVGYRWFLGDGSAPIDDTEPRRDYTFAAPGRYEVRLRVTDSAGGTGEATRVVSIGGGGGTDGTGDTGGSSDAGGGTAGGGTTGGTTGGGDGGTGGGESGGASTDGGGTGAGTGGGTSAYCPALSADEEAARLLAQASFGPTAADIAAVRRQGIAGWIDDQLARPVNPQSPRVTRIAVNTSDSNARHEVWWQDVVDADDQLRQRVAFALSEIFVVADTGYTLRNAQDGMVAYYDRLLAGAFGAYRDLLEEVTLSPVMGTFLSMLQNARGTESASGNTRADENYAREILQLFSIGLYRLDKDGTVRTSGGRPVPAFGMSEVTEYARVFTGWNFAGASRWSMPLPSTANDWVSRMAPVRRRGVPRPGCQAAAERRGVARRRLSRPGSRDRAGLDRRAPERRAVHRPAADRETRDQQPVPRLRRSRVPRLRRLGRQYRRDGAGHPARSRGARLRRRGRELRKAARTAAALQPPVARVRHHAGHGLFRRTVQRGLALQEGFRRGLRAGAAALAVGVQLLRPGLRAGRADPQPRPGRAGGGVVQRLAGALDHRAHQPADPVLRRHRRGQPAHSKLS